MNYIFFGLKGCGKTFWGKQLAAQKGIDFVDTDEFIAKRYGASCPEIYQDVGEAGFRALEGEAVDALSGIKNTLIALGGGTLMDSNNHKKLHQLGVLIHLVASKDALKKRLLQPPLPAFFDPQNPEASFESYYVERSAFYHTIPSKKLDTEQGDILKQWAAIVLATSFQ